MEVVAVKQEDMSQYGKTTSCLVYSAHIKIKDIKIYAKDMIQLIEDTSWIKKLGPIEQTAFDARAKRTIEELAKNIFSKVEDAPTKDFGEYMVSISAQDVLNKNLIHIKIPLAELWKEKVTGNPGFDFHTESDCKIVVFGEAKYSSSDNPYTEAIKQILSFITLRKDDSELSDLSHFVSDDAKTAYLDGKKAYVAAFSINSLNPSNIIANVLKSTNIDQLLAYPKLFVVGVEVDV
ncbi:MAG: hypothetical protein WDO70_05980 [Alphaproteobacteria bacterium]